MVLRRSPWGSSILPLPNRKSSSSSMLLYDTPFAMILYLPLPHLSESIARTLRARACAVVQPRSRALHHHFRSLPITACRSPRRIEGSLSLILSFFLLTHSALRAQENPTPNSPLPPSLILSLSLARTPTPHGAISPCTTTVVRRHSLPLYQPHTQKRGGLIDEHEE